MNTSCSKACLCENTSDHMEQCKNYLLCNSLETKDILDSHDGLCVYCYILNGKLEISENVANQDCSFCLLVNKYVVEFSKKCEHHICVDCYKKKIMFDGDTPETNKSEIFIKCSICPESH
jgi:hypothetical protein